MAKIVIASYLVRLPVGGYLSWMLQWLLGFRTLGHDVYFVEKSGWPESCFDLKTWRLSDDCSTGVAAVRDLFARVGLGQNWCFVDSTGQYHGLSRERIEAVFQTADLFIDHLRTCEWAEEAAMARLRVMVDGEPGFTQIQMLQKLESGQPVTSFDRYYSVGLNVGSPASSVPTAGKIWRPIVDPVVLELFPYKRAKPNAPFTTVMSWQAHPPIRFEGRVYGQKDLEFPKFIDLPRLTTASLELAIAGKDVPTAQLQGLGWRLRNSTDVTATFDSWVQYLQGSSGEFSVCKNVFVATNSGFFSDRSAAYLASGRPVVMQETGFSSHIPCGRGLFAVRTVEEAAAAIDEIRGDYDRHSKWAREIAAEHLEAGRVLRNFLCDLGM